MIILKVKADAGSEDPIPWALAAVAYVFSLLSLVGTPFGILYVRPIYGFLSELIPTAAIYYFRSVAKNRHPVSVDETAPH